MLELDLFFARYTRDWVLGTRVKFGQRGVGSKNK